MLGIPVLAPDDLVRHLGILLSAAGQAAANLAMFEKRRVGVLLCVRAWARFDLSYLGRLQVAKQVLASSLYYHASFVPPPADKLDGIIRLIDHFVANGRVLEGEDGVAPMRKVPSAAVGTLPPELGGLGRADILAQCLALHAKVAALLLHPRRHPWKVLMRRAFERWKPDLGVAALVSTLMPVADGTGDYTRHMAYWKGLHALSPFRLVAPEVLPAYHVLGEHLVRNAQVTGLNGVDTTVVRCPGPLRHFPAAGGTPITLATVRAACACDVPEVAGVARQLAVLCLPEAWHQHVLPGPLRRAQWFVSSCGKWVRDGRAPPQDTFEVRPDGRLGPLTSPLPNGGGVGWTPACVVWCPVPKGQRLLVRVEPRRHLHGLEVFLGEEDPPQAYLLGAWGAPSTLVDPNVWGWGTQLPLSHFVVKGAARRLILLGMCRTSESFVPAEGVRPRLFAAPSGVAPTGLVGLELEQARQFELLWERTAATSSGTGRRVRRRLEDAGGLVPEYEAAWMRRSVARAHPYERAAARPATTVRRVDDGRDVLLFYGSQRPREWGGPGDPPWVTAYKGLLCKRLDRKSRFFGWLLVHGALRCGGAVCSWAQTACLEDLVQECACQAECCSGPAAPEGVPPPCETLSHVFVTCPVVSPAVGWLRDLWRRVGGSLPPLDARVLVVGDKSVWEPEGGRSGWELWSHLRLLFCRSVWALTSRRRVSGQQFAAAAVVAMTAAVVEQAVRLDWQRAWVGTALAGRRPVYVRPDDPRLVVCPSEVSSRCL